MIQKKVVIGIFAVFCLIILACKDKSTGLTGPEPQNDGRILVVLVHGLFGGDNYWGPSGMDLGTLLVEDGYNVKYFKYPQSEMLDDFNVPIEDLASILNDSLKSWNIQFGIETKGVYIVAHSMGGLISRYLISRSFGVFPIAKNIKKLAVLGTPNYGAAAASWFNIAPIANQVRQMDFGSEFLWNLHKQWADPAFNVDVDMLSIVGSQPSPLKIDKESDVIVRVSSASLENFEIPIFFEDELHWDMGKISSREHPSYKAIQSFFAGQELPLDNVNMDRLQTLDRGMLVLELVNSEGQRIPIKDVKGIPLLASESINSETGTYVATGMAMKEYQLTIVPNNSAEYEDVLGSVTIHPHQANVYTFVVPSKESGENCSNFPPPLGEIWTYRVIGNSYVFSLITEPVNELINGYRVYRVRRSDNPPGLGDYVGCDKALGEIWVASDWWDVNDPSNNGRDVFEKPIPIDLCPYGSPVGTKCVQKFEWGGRVEVEVLDYEDVTVPYKTFQKTR